MTDVCPFSLGTATVGNAPGEPEKMCMMIERNSVLPCREEMIFTTAVDYQERILFKIYQGENYNPDQTGTRLFGRTESFPGPPAVRAGCANQIPGMAS